MVERIAPRPARRAGRRAARHRVGAPLADRRARRGGAVAAASAPLRLTAPPATIPVWPQPAPTGGSETDLLAAVRARAARSSRVSALVVSAALVAASTAFVAAVTPSVPVALGRRVLPPRGAGRLVDLRPVVGARDQPRLGARVQLLLPAARAHARDRLVERLARPGRVRRDRGRHERPRRARAPRPRGGRPPGRGGPARRAAGDRHRHGAPTSTTPSPGSATRRRRRSVRRAASSSAGRRRRAAPMRCRSS